MINEYGDEDLWNSVHVPLFSYCAQEIAIPNALICP